MDILRFALPSCRGTDLRPIGGGKGHGLTGLGTLTMGSDDEKGRGAECPVDESPSIMSPQQAGPRCDGCDAMRTNGHGPSVPRRVLPFFILNEEPPPLAHFAGIVAFAPLENW